MTVDIGLNQAERKAIGDALARLLADTYTLYIKSHGFHWNVTGPHFPSLHAMLQQQYEEMALAIDEIAERIRALGHLAPGSFAEFARLASVKEEKRAPAAMDMVRRLVADHERVVKTARAAAAAAEKAGDQASLDLATERMRIHEKTAWMLRATAEE
ncbi:MAG: DNA starvation/stationary phase protection protein [Proteobacteria bacterium]|nr:DNA starvation/stationary phase protection protein [Pseudomonadota bacterium]